MSSLKGKLQYIERMQNVIELQYKCKATHRRSVTVQDRTVGEGLTQVEIFWLTGHPSAKRCFAWVEECPARGGEPQVTAILEIPPVIGPATALRAASR